MIVFGGDSQKRQISEIDNCALKRIGDLSFDHDSGACTTDDKAKDCQLYFYIL